MEHSGTCEETDRATDLSVLLRHQPLRLESRATFTDKRVGATAALWETGRDLTLEMGETFCRRWLTCGRAGRFHGRFEKGW